jgi:uncharacterized peroxidase-related enzyme
MAHINVPEGVPGIRSLFMFRPETGKILCDLAQVLLRGESDLSSAERELIATYVSHLNKCMFCMSSHAAASRCLYHEQSGVVDDVLEDLNNSDASDKIKALLHIAGLTRSSGKEVTEADVAAARDAGATERDIHDTVLIAASFSMFNRYVDGLGSLTPGNPSDYIDMGKRMAERGYIF